MVPKKTVIVAYCPECDGDRAVEIVAEHSQTFNSEAYDSNTLYRILKCRACNHVQFQTCSTNSEDIEHSYDPETKEPVAEYAGTLRFFHQSQSALVPTGRPPPLVQPGNGAPAQ
jgi:hypothetical protein